MGSRTLDNMLRSGRFALVEGEPSLKGAISAPAPMSPGPLARRRSPVAHWPLSPTSGAFPSFQTWPPDAKSPRSPGGCLASSRGVCDGGWKPSDGCMVTAPLYGGVCYALWMHVEVPTCRKGWCRSSLLPAAPI